MYIWLGIDVDGQLPEVRCRAVAIERELGLRCSCFTLPMHVTLKMAFEVSDDERAGEIIAAAEKYYASQAAFMLRVRGIEADGPIAWIRMERSPEIDRLHDGLNGMLAECFGIGLHEYDTDHKFHTTLFMDTDEAKVSAAAEMLRDVTLPEAVAVRRLVIGTSETGELGSYSIFKTVCI